MAEALAQIRSVLGPGGFDPGARHVFRLAMSDYGAALVLPALMRHLRQDAPGVELIVSQGSREAMIAAVSDGTADVALGVFPDLPTQLMVTPLLQDRYVCLLDPTHQPGWTGTLTADRFWAAPHVHVAVQGGLATELDLHLRRAGQARRIALVLPHWGIAPGVIAGTDLILKVASRAVPAPPAPLLLVPPPVALPSIPFNLIGARRRKADPALLWLTARLQGAVLQ